MHSIRRKIKSVSGDISSGSGTHTVHLERGVDCQGVVLQLTSGSATSAQISLVELFVNGKSRGKMTGAQLDAYNPYHKRSALASLNNTLFIPLAFYNSLDASLTENSGVPFDGEVVYSAWLEITYSGATTPKAEYSVVGDLMRPSRVGGDMRTVYSTTATLTNGQKRILSDLPYGEGMKAHQNLMRLFLVDGSGAVTDLEIELDGVRIYKSNNLVDACIKDAEGRVTPGSYFCPIVFDAIETGFPNGIDLKGLKTSDSKLDIKAIGNADETLPALVEFLGPAV
jgi:hypothetical protein